MIYRLESTDIQGSSKLTQAPRPLPSNEKTELMTFIRVSQLGKGELSTDSR